jgi:hypothetical protein
LKILAVVERTKYYNDWITTLEFFSDVHITLEDYENALNYLEQASLTCKIVYGDKKIGLVVQKKTGHAIEKRPSVGQSSLINISVLAPIYYFFCIIVSFTLTL